MNELLVKSLSKTFPIDGVDILVLDKIDFCVQSGEIVCLLGPSGCGKSTLLRMIANLDVQTDGQIILPIRDHHFEPRIGMVFQEQGLFPWMSVTQNIRFVLDNNRQFDGRDKTNIVQEIIAKLGLSKYREALPQQLSGGMRQRVSIGRALANESDILLMDEPFVFLDYQTRLSIQQLLLDLWQELKMTILFVTHDIEEAIFLGDRIMVFSAQPGTILDIVDVSFARPRDLLKLKRQAQFQQLVDHLSGLIMPLEDNNMIAEGSDDA